MSILAFEFFSDKYCTVSSCVELKRLQGVLKGEQGTDCTYVQQALNLALAKKNQRAFSLLTIWPGI